MPDILALTFSCQWLSPEGDSCHRPAADKGSLCRWHRIQKRIADPFEMSGWNISESKRILYFYSAQELCDYLLILLCIGAFQKCQIFSLVFSSTGSTTNNALSNPTYLLIYLSWFLGLFGVVLTRLGKMGVPGWIYDHPFLLSIFMYGLCFWLLRLPQVYLQNSYIQSAIAITFLLPISAAAFNGERRTGLASSGLVCAGLGLLFITGLVGPISESLHKIFGGFDLFREASDPKLRQQMASLSVWTGIGFCAIAIDSILALSSTGYFLTPFPRKGSPYYKWLQRNERHGFVYSFLRILFYVVVLFLILYSQGQLVRWLLWPVVSILDRIPYWDLLYLGLATAGHYSIAQAIQRQPGYDDLPEEDQFAERKSVLSVRPEYVSERRALEFYIHNLGDKATADYAWHLLIPQQVLTGNTQIFDDDGFQLPANLSYTIDRVTYLSPLKVSGF